MAGLEDLKIYKMACSLEKKVYKLTESFPNEEKFRQVDQMKRASASVCDNVAEGYGKYSYQSRIQSFYTARAEAMEVQNQIKRAADKNFVELKRIEKLFSNYTELIKAINGFIKYQRNRKEELVT